MVESNLLLGKTLGGKKIMYTTMELAVAAIGLAWLIQFASACVFYARIDKEQKEMWQMKEKIDRTEASIKKMTGCFLAVKSGQSAS